jgi:hypothetical protein
VIGLSGTTGRINAGGNNKYGQLNLLDAANSITVQLDASGGGMVGGNGMDGEIRLFRKRSNQVVATATVLLEGASGKLNLGGSGVDGWILIKGANGQQRIQLDGKGGNLWLGGNGADVTHDGENWFFTQNPDDAPKLWKFPVGHDLDEDVDGSNPSSGISNVGLPSSLSGYIHAGDIDYYDGHIYVPLQFGQPRKVAVYDAQSLDFIAAGDLEANGTAAWCAISPLNGLLYESKFYESDESSSDTTVSVYQRHLQANGLTLTYQGEFELFDSNGSKIILKRIQGEAFSKNGHSVQLFSGTSFRHFRRMK